MINFTKCDKRNYKVTHLFYCLGVVINYGLMHDNLCAFFLNMLIIGIQSTVFVANLDTKSNVLFWVEHFFLLIQLPTEASLSGVHYHYRWSFFNPLYSQSELSIHREHGIHFSDWYRIPIWKYKLYTFCFGSWESLWPHTQQHSFPFGHWHSQKLQLCSSPSPSIALLSLHES